MMINGFRQRISGRFKKGKMKSVQLITGSTFQVIEAYKILRTNLLFALAAGENKVVVISSALPSEGKSSTCANLAAAMAQTGAKVVLIDADLRKPTQNQIFKCDNSRGLSGILAGFNDLEEVIERSVNPNLDIITSGPIPPNPSELLGCEQMSCLLAHLSKEYEYVFIDTPPINVVADALIISNKAAGVVMVVRHGHSTYNELTKAVSRVEFANAVILGLVVNGIKEKSGMYGKHKYGKYSSYSRK